MEYLDLKHSDLKVSRLCMGGCQLGGYGWGKVLEEDLLKAVRTALDYGINFFDTADTYGLGKSEETLGNALRDRRSEVVIATKFGVRIENGRTFYDNNPEYIEKAAEASLRRLHTDYIDLYQLHYRDEKTSMKEILGAVEKLKAKGYIRYFGLSNLSNKDITELKQYTGQFISLQNEYSLACRKHEKELLQASEVVEVTPITWGSLGQGILTGKYDFHSSFGPDDRRHRDIYVNFHKEKLEKNLEIVEEMKAISIQTNKQLPAIAIRFILDYIPGSVVIAGVKNAKQLLMNIDSMDWKLTKEQLDRLSKISYPTEGFL